MYTIAKYFVQYKFMKSDPIASNIGMKHGNPASGILCLFFFLNDILDNINNNVNGIIHIDEIRLFLF